MLATEGGRSSATPCKDDIRLLADLVGISLAGWEFLSHSLSWTEHRRQRRLWLQRAGTVQSRLHREIGGRIPGTRYLTSHLFWDGSHSSSPARVVVAVTSIGRCQVTDRFRLERSGHWKSVRIRGQYTIFFLSALRSCHRVNSILFPELQRQTLPTALFSQGNRRVWLHNRAYLLRCHQYLKDHPIDLRSSFWLEEQ